MGYTSASMGYCHTCYYAGNSQQFPLSDLVGNSKGEMFHKTGVDCYGRMAADRLIQEMNAAGPQQQYLPNVDTQASSSSQSGIVCSHGCQLNKLDKKHDTTFRHLLCGIVISLAGSSQVQAAYCFHRKHKAPHPIIGSFDATKGDAAKSIATHMGTHFNTTAPSTFGLNGDVTSATVPGVGSDRQDCVFKISNGSLTLNWQEKQA